MLAPVIHINPLTLIRRERVLPVAGKVVVRKGQKVAATDVVAEASIDPNHMLLDVGRGLGLSPKAAAARIQVKAGDKVSEGDVLAGPVGFPRRVVRAPYPGRIAWCSNGQILLEAQAKPFELKAGLPGTVIDLFENHGVVVECTGALVQGVWGNGKLDYGLMNVVADDPGQILTLQDLDVSLRGSIVLAGHASDAEVLKSAGETPLRGLILSSMEPALIRVANELPIPVMLVEGFGQRPMNSAAYKLLTTNAGREVALNAEAWNRYSGIRPEVIVPLPAAVTPPLLPETVEMARDQQVRVIRGARAGKIATLIDFRGQSTLSNGIKTQVIEIRLEDGEVAVVPMANVEVLQ